MAQKSVDYQRVVKRNCQTCLVKSKILEPESMIDIYDVHLQTSKELYESSFITLMSKSKASNEGSYKEGLDICSTNES